MTDYNARNFLVRATLLRDRIGDPNRFPFTIPAIGGLDTIEFTRPVTFFIGENGAGKSTLLEAIAVARGLNAEGGSRNFRFATRASHSELHRCLRLSRSARRVRDSYFLRAESFYNVATEIEAMDEDGGLGAPVIDSYGASRCTSNRTVNPSSHCSRTGCGMTACISSTNPKPPCRRHDNSPFCRCCTTWFGTGRSS